MNGRTRAYDKRGTFQDSKRNCTPRPCVYEFDGTALKMAGDSLKLEKMDLQIQLYITDQDKLTYTKF